MFRIIAKWYAKRQYIWRQEVDAATNELNAGLSSKLSTEKRALIDQLYKEADDIDKRIEEFSKMETIGFWQCENGHEEHLSTAFAGVELEISRTCSTCEQPMKHTRRDLMTGQEQYESDKERKAAEDVADNKRAQAKAEEENADGSDKTAKYFRDLAKNNRHLADKIRKL